MIRFFAVVNSNTYSAMNYKAKQVTFHIFYQWLQATPKTMNSFVCSAIQSKISNLPHILSKVVELNWSKYTEFSFGIDHKQVAEN